MIEVEKDRGRAREREGEEEGREAGRQGGRREAREGGREGGREGDTKGGRGRAALLSHTATSLKYGYPQTTCQLLHNHLLSLRHVATKRFPLSTDESARACADARVHAQRVRDLAERAGEDVHHEDGDLSRAQKHFSRTSTSPSCKHAWSASCGSTLAHVLKRLRAHTRLRNAYM